MNSALTALTLVLACTLPACSSETTGDDLQGVASVIDGDTIEIHGTRIRLNGIDAPESGQLCQDARGTAWRCGHAAVKKALQLGAVGFDAVKHLVLCHVEKRPPKLDLDVYPYLPRANVETTSAASYMALMSEDAA